MILKKTKQNRNHFSNKVVLESHMRQYPVRFQTEEYTGDRTS